MGSILNNKDMVERADQLIRLKATGTPEEFAKKLNISKRSLFRLLNSLKEIGCPIVYNNYKGCYEYQYRGEVIIKFKPDSDPDEEDKEQKPDFNSKEGSSKNILPDNYKWRSD